MNAMIFNQLLADAQESIKLQYKLLQIKGIQQTSQFIGLMITIMMMTAIAVIGLIFLAIALAAWLEQWLPMWASYLVIAGAILLIALAICWGRKWWFTRPIEKRLNEAILEETTPLEQQKQSIENQLTMQHELLQRDMNTIQQEWSQIERILQLIRSMIS